VAAGGDPREVAAQLCLRPRTIEAPLSSIFRKPGMTSRRHLRDHLPGAPEARHAYLRVGSSVTITDAKALPGTAGWTRLDLPPTFQSYGKPAQ
jgi:hypothetical protein